MDHVVSPEDVEPIEVIDLEADVAVCALTDCTNEIDIESYECDDCHQDYCSTHVLTCHYCNDWVCTACANSFAGQLYCSYCYNNMTTCFDCDAVINTDADTTGYCDSHDKWFCGQCYWGNNLCNSCAQDSETTSNHEDDSCAHAMGLMQCAPWEARGVHSAHDSYAEANDVSFAAFDAQTIWGVDSDLSLNEGAADFYLLDVVQHNVDCGHIVEPMLVVMAEEAKAHRKKLVEIYDPTFCGYVDMAIGGELRYHKAVGGGRHLPESRTQAWRYWKLLRERGGVELLLETAALFEEIQGGGVGGKAWADAARLLHARLTNRITPEQWVDRVFTLQHNGGAFTNKIAWGPDKTETGADIQQVIGPAHAANPPDYYVLRQNASTTGRALFEDWWPVANKNRMRWRYQPWIMRNPSEKAEAQQMYSWMSAFISRAWSTTSIQNAHLASWTAHTEAASARFRPFYVARRLASQYGIHISWTTIDKKLARDVVMRTLYPGHYTTQVNAANMNRVFPEYLHWMCQLIANSHLSLQAEAFKFLYSRGYIIPMEYREAAGMSLELEPF